MTAYEEDQKRDVLINRLCLSSMAWRRTWQAGVHAAEVLDDRGCPVVLPGNEQRAVAVYCVERLLVEEPDQAVRVDLRAMRLNNSAPQASAPLSLRLDEERRSAPLAVGPFPPAL